MLAFRSVRKFWRVDVHATKCQAFPNDGYRIDAIKTFRVLPAAVLLPDVPVVQKPYQCNALIRLPDQGIYNVRFFLLVLHCS